MDSATIRRLTALNAQFYADHALAFAQRRRAPQAGAQRLLTRLQTGERVLEIGCGDGKLIPAVLERGATYTGVDLSPELLQLAARRVAPPQTVELLTADLADPHWAQTWQSATFHWIWALAVFHHVPGYATRVRAVQQCAALLAPGGQCAISNWQFTRSTKLRTHTVPWAMLGLTEVDVEPKDYLLNWERNERTGLRYVHLLDETEARQLAAEAGLSVSEIFTADGESGDLSDYVIMEKRV